MIRIINRITIPTEGRVFYKGKPMTEEMVRSIGYLPEERGLYKKMKVGEQALYLARLRGMSAAKASEELKFWFRKFQIQSWWDKKVEELSKGMAQKVQFITTVVHKPSLLILDEPFSGFDPVNTQLVRNEIMRLRDEGTTIILSTHNMESVEELCDNIALINKSNLVLTGETDEIRRKYGTNQIEVIYTSGSPLAPDPAFEVYKDEQLRNNRRAVLNLSCDPTEALNTILKQGVEIESFHKLLPRMNDIFIKLVSQ